MRLTLPQEVELLKFIAQHPFAEIDLTNDDASQILIIDYAQREVTLRDFCTYSVLEIINETNGFKDPKINKQWLALAQKYHENEE